MNKTTQRGRPPLGDRAMTQAERSRRYRQRLAQRDRETLQSIISVLKSQNQHEKEQV